MKIHEIVRSADPVIGILPESYRVFPGDIVVLKSKRGSRKFIMIRDISTAEHCTALCGISRRTCKHYEFICPYYCYLKPIDDFLEEL